MPKKLYVGGLPWATSNEKLQELFEAFGEVTDAKIVTDRESGRSRGFGFVTFARDEDANAALSMDGRDFDGRTLKVSISTSTGPKQGGSSRAY